MKSVDSVPLPLLDLKSPAATLETVGGKGANLAKLARAGFPVPDGFLIPTTIYRSFVVTNGLDETIRSALDGLPFDDTARLESASARIRSAFDHGVVDADFRERLADAYRVLGEPPVAVRSSATAEDLPDMSFAGQQDTFLNVLGFDDLCVAVVHCWSSLWTARAIGYRARNQVSQDDVSLAVVVQQMVPANASGVLFTANPLTGRRTETAIDATLGLGEALVSGQVEPDHYVVDAALRTILQKTLGAKATTIVGRSGGGTETRIGADDRRQAVPDNVILELTDLGQRVASLYDSPQDIEWAWADNTLYLVQSRPITSLFPLPAGMQPEPLKVMMAFSAVQGIFEPLTPLGQDTMKLVLTGGGRVLGYNTTIERQQIFYVAAERLYINFSPVLHNAVGRQILPRIIGAIDPGVAQAFQEVIKDPRLAPTGAGISVDALRRLLRFILPTARRIRQAWRDPDEIRKQLTDMMDDTVAETTARMAPAGDLWVDYARRLELLYSASNLFPDLVVPYGVSAVIAGMIPFFGVLQRFAQEAAAVTGQPQIASLPLEIARSLPHNVTTEMDLTLWQIAQIIRADAETASIMSSTPAADLAARYLRGDLPIAAQAAIAAFLDRYGMRGLGEIDIGRPRWREQPEHIMQVLQSYLNIADPARAPDVVFASGVQAAAAAADALEAAVSRTRGGRLKLRLVRWAITRYRALAGLREAPKFFAIRMLGITRQGLLRSGESFVALGLLDQKDDLFFLHLNELGQIADQRAIEPEFRALIAERRVLRARELGRKQLPRVLLSDGTSYYEGVRSTGGDENTIIGDPVSPGVVEGSVRVVFDPSGTQLVPGEILVCPGTDPAWTPLFLAAGGLIMEVGGMMTHGSVVAREYGISGDCWRPGGDHPAADRTAGAHGWGHRCYYDKRLKKGA